MNQHELKSSMARATLAALALLAVPSMAPLARAAEHEKEARRTARGDVFVKSDISYTFLDRAAGEAWLDPNGQVIWGDVLKDSDDKARVYSHPEASARCRELGGRLPSVQDFKRLRTYFGASPESNKGYVPQVLPNLFYAVKKSSADGTSSLELYPRLLWASDVSPSDSAFAFIFASDSGGLGINLVDGKRGPTTHARCVWE